MNTRWMKGESMAQESIEKMIYDETERRLAIMEKPDYEFPSKSGKLDVIGIVISIVASLILLILCMMGVIS